MSSLLDGDHPHPRGRHPTSGWIARQQRFHTFNVVHTPSTLTSPPIVHDNSSFSLHLPPGVIPQQGHRIYRILGVFTASRAPTGHLSAHSLPRNRAFNDFIVVMEKNGFFYTGFIISPVLDISFHNCRRKKRKTWDPVLPSQYRHSIRQHGSKVRGVRNPCPLAIPLHAKRR